MGRESKSSTWERGGVWINSTGWDAVPCKVTNWCPFEFNVSTRVSKIRTLFCSSIFTTSRVGLLSPFGYSRRWPLGKAGAADSLRWTSCAPRLHTKGFFFAILCQFFMDWKIKTVHYQWIGCFASAKPPNETIRVGRNVWTTTNLLKMECIKKGEKHTWLQPQTSVVMKMIQKLIWKIMKDD